MVDVLIKFPTRERPELFKQTLDKWRNGRVRILVTIHDDDTTMNNPTMLSYLDSLPDVTYKVVTVRGKIANANAGLEGEQFDIVVQAADDEIPQVEHYDILIAEAMTKYFPDLDGMLWVYDGRNPDVPTVPILGKKYYDRFGYIYHPSYESVWCDNEALEVASNFKPPKVHKINDVWIKHYWKDLTGDALLDWTQSFYDKDYLNYQSRRSAGFPK